MKYIKKFDSHYFHNYNYYTIDDIKEDDYVKVNYGSAMDPKVLKFLDKNFGIITYININKNYFYVRYENVPENIKNYFMEVGYMQLEFDISGLEEFAPTIEELELKLSTNKYNL